MEILTPQNLETLSSLPAQELESLRTQLDSLRAQIVGLQNSRAPLLRLPGEIRNQIYHAAMRAELAHRDDSSRRTCRPPGCGDGGAAALSSSSSPEILLSEPALLRVCRATRGDAMGIWYGDMAIWEEWCAEPPVNGKEGGGREGGGGRGGGRGRWQRLDPAEVRALRLLRAKLGPARVPIHRVFCGEEKMKEAVRESWSVCARRGTVWFEGLGRSCGMRWWVW